MSVRAERRHPSLVRRLEEYWQLHPTRAPLVLLVVLALVLSVPILLIDGWNPVGLLALPLLLGSLLLGPRELPWFVAFVLVQAVVLLAWDWPPRAAGLAEAGTLGLLGAIVLWVSYRRNRLGVGGLTGESMLVDLRDQILAHGTIPPLPTNWQVESVLRSAGGSPFAGDFVVAARVAGSARFDLALVDVSGKGEQAGTRALLLSGALGGLLSALPPADFLAEANAFLLRQQWDEGFATAIHLSLDLGTGNYEIRVAGHPPAMVHRCEGPTDACDSWEEVEAEGPVLGWLPNLQFEPARGRLAPGDSLLLYTDGMVETRSVALDEGIERLTESATPVLSRPLTHQAVDRLVGALGSHDDDRALVAVRRGESPV